MPEVLYVVAPYWAQAPVSVHCDPDRAMAIDPVTAEWRTTDAPHLIHPDDPHHVRERLAGELCKIGDDLLADG